jgi:ABC-type nitrate/sulfonate/bicarbonate transport system substrate-binding protein
MRKKIVVFLLTVVCLFCGVACGKDTHAIVTVYAPDGAPALALAYSVWKNERADARYKIVNAESVPALVSYDDEEKNADICVMPVNLAAKLLGDGKRYLLLGVATHGNLFLLGGGEKITKENAEVLKGKTVGVVQFANVPGLVTKAALARLGIGFNSLSGGVAFADKVNLKAVQPSKDLATLGVDYLVVGSPIAEGLGLPFAGSLQELYGEKGYPQAVVVAKRSFVEKNGAWITDFLAELDFCGEWLKTIGADKVFATYQSVLDMDLKGAFRQENLTAQTLENAGVYFTSAKDSKQEILEFLQEITEIGGGEFPLSDGFFYGVD